MRTLLTPCLLVVAPALQGSGESSYPADTKDSWTTEFAKMGTMGYTLLASSGDVGTGHTGLFSCGARGLLPCLPPWPSADGCAPLR